MYNYNANNNLFPFITIPYSYTFFADISRESKEVLLFPFFVVVVIVIIPATTATTRAAVVALLKLIGIYLLVPQRTETPTIVWFACKRNTRLV